MARRRRRRNELVDDLMPALAFGAVGAGVGVLGGAVDPLLPAGVGNPVAATGTTLSRFAPVVTTVVGGKIVLKQIGKIGKTVRKGKRRRTLL